MNFKLVTLTIILSALVIVAPITSAAPVLDNVHYIVNGDINEIDALTLKLNYDFDNINSFNPVFTYHEEEIKLKGSWNIKFLRDMNQISSMDLALSLATSLKDLSPEPAIGLAGNVNYLEHNQINWQLDYYFNKPGDKWVYHGGVALPLSTSGELTLGFGNSYWYMDQPVFDLGLRVDL